MAVKPRITVVGGVFAAVMLSTTIGCTVPAQPVTTVWQRLGIPQAGVRLRDGLVNRRGNFPGLERKPPVLKIADPANLDPEKPEMLQVAAKIKQDQDLQKQKIKALKYLAEIGCGCYNKDGKVEAAFLEALDDCDPEIRKVAIKGLSEAAGNCPECCRSGCEITCCTEKLYKKLQDIAFGVERGCYKEPSSEIRDAAKALLCKCPTPCPEDLLKPIDPPEELVRPEESDPPDVGGPPIGYRVGDRTNTAAANPSEIYSLMDDLSDAVDGQVGLIESVSATMDDTADDVMLSLSDSTRHSPTHLVSTGNILPSQLASSVTEQAVALQGRSATATRVESHDVQSRQAPMPAREQVSSIEATAANAELVRTIANPELLIQSRSVTYNVNFGELLLQLPEAYDLRVGWTMIVADSKGNLCKGRIAEFSGRRLLLVLGDERGTMQIEPRTEVKVGVIAQ